MEKPKNTSSNGKTIFWVVVMVLVAIGYCNRDKTSTTKEENYSVSSNEMKITAYLFSQEFVKNELKAPHTAVFPDADFNLIDVNDSDSTFTVRSYVDAQNAFGASIRNRYNVKLRFTGGNMNDGHNWELLDIHLYDEN